MTSRGILRREHGGEDHLRRAFEALPGRELQNVQLAGLLTGDGDGVRRSKRSIRRRDGGGTLREAPLRRAVSRAGEERRSAGFLREPDRRRIVAENRDALGVCPDCACLGEADMVSPV